jgi:hypothetical protein
MKNSSLNDILPQQKSQQSLSCEHKYKGDGKILGKTPNELP